MTKEYLMDWVSKYDKGENKLPDDHKKSFAWFEEQGWGRKWPLHRYVMYGDVKSIKLTIEDDGYDPNQAMTDW